jgi:amino acid adenylation domain-containing protein
VSGAAERLPLTAAQRGIWLGQALDPESPAYWTAELVELEGELDERLFQSAVRSVLEESRALHARFDSTRDELEQHFAPHGVELPLHDFSRMDAPEAAAREWIADDLQTQADLARGPLFRTALLRTSARLHFWYLRVHHITLDGYGYTLLQRRVARVYDALKRGAAVEAASTASLAAWVSEDQTYRASRSFERDRAFWHARLERARAPRLLAPGRAVARSVRRSHGKLSSELYGSLQASATRVGVDGSAWLIAAVLAWLHRESDAAEQIVGLPVTARLGSVAATLPCMMMNIVPLRTHLAEEATFIDFARDVQRELRALRPHQRYRYEDLKRELGYAGGSRRLFGAVINLMPFEPPSDFGNLRAKIHPVSAGPVEDLSIALSPKPDGLHFALEANPDAYAQGRLDDLYQALTTALGALAESAEGRVRELPVSEGARSAAKRAPSLLVGERLTAPPLPLLDALQEAERLAPERVAIEQDDHSPLTYGVLLREVRALAARFRAAGVGEESRVALLLPRSPEAIVAQLAVLWTGGAYVPLDPSGPQTRIALVLEDAKPTLLVTLRQHAALGASITTLFVDDGAPAKPNEPLLQPVDVRTSALAYVIYTSGSTGRPQGVQIERGALDHFVAAARQRYAFGPTDRVLQFAPLQFDASVEEIMVSLASGATLVLRTDAMLESLDAFLHGCERQRITVLDLPTAFWHELALSLGESLALPESVRLTIIGGEAALAERVARWRGAVSPSVVLLNTYGPTETTVVCTAADLAGPDAAELTGELSIGRPLPGVDVALVDGELRVVPFGEEGELCVLGPQLARGYFGREDTTAHRFVSLPTLGGRRGYLTGDRAQLAPDGALRYLGRSDDEVKISGHRVSPLEVETALLDQGEITEAAVISRDDDMGNKRLDAFLVGSPISAVDVRARLSTRLSAPAIPSSFHFLERLPRDPNGKIDRNALRRLPRAANPTSDDGSSLATHATPLERIVLDVWQDVLQAPVRSRDADFFALGGHSLLALQVSHRLSRALGCELPLSVLYRAPTAAALVAALGAQIATARASAASDPLIGIPSSALDPLAPLLELSAGQGPALFCIHPGDGLSWCYLGLTRHLQNVPIFAIQAPGFTGTSPESFEATVLHYLDLVRTTQAEGPYRLLGWSSGGGLAHAIAHELRVRGHEVSLLAMLDSHPADIWVGTPDPTEQDALASMLDDLDASAQGSNGETLTSEELLARLKQPGGSLAHLDDATLLRMGRTALASMKTYRTARHPRYGGDLLYFRAAQRTPDAPRAELWSPYVAGRFECIDVNARHLGMCHPEPLAEICRTLRQRL